MKVIERIYDLNNEFMRGTTHSQLVSIDLDDVYSINIKTYRGEHSVVSRVDVYGITDHLLKLILDKITSSMFKDLFTLDGITMYQCDKFINKLLVDCEYFHTLREKIYEDNFQKLKNRHTSNNSTDSLCDSYRPYFAQMQKEFSNYIQSHLDITPETIEMALIALTNISYRSSKCNFNSKRWIDITVMDNEIVTINIHELSLNVKSYN